MTINQIIVSALTDLGYKIYFLQKPDGLTSVSDYITFNYTVNSDWYSNDKPEADTYNVTLNIVTPKPEMVFKMDNEVREALKAVDSFTGVSNQGSIYDKEVRTYYSVVTFETLI